MNYIFIFWLISFLNGVLFFLSVSHFRLRKIDYLISGLTGNASYLLFGFLNSHQMFGIAVFTRIFLWFFALTFVYKKNHPEIKIDYIFFRIAIIVTLKLFFEKVIFTNMALDYNYQNIFPVIYGWIPLILIGAVLNKETTEELDRRDLNFIKIATTTLATVCLVYAYYFLLKNF